MEYIEPMKAKLSDIAFLSSVSNDPRWVAGEKFDGYRELLYLGTDHNELISSGGNNHIHCVPQFKVVIPELADTILDCEGMAPTRRLEDNAGCFKCDPQSAIAWQDKHGMAFLVTFDILQYRGQLIIDMPFMQRRRFLEDVYATMIRHSFFNTQLRLEKLVIDNKLAYYNQITARTTQEGHEGIILKDMRAPYQPGKRGNAWLKVKRFESLTYYIIDFEPGTGKYEGMVGAVVYGVNNGFYTALGTASGMTDGERLDMTDHPEKYLNKKALFECQEITDNGVMRHPRYIRMQES